MNAVEFLEKYSGYSISFDMAKQRDSGSCASCGRIVQIRFATGKEIYCSMCNFFFRNHDEVNARLSLGSYAIIKKSGSIYFFNSKHPSFDFRIDESKARHETQFKEFDFISEILKIAGKEDHIAIAFSKKSLKISDLAINDRRYDYVNIGGNNFVGFNYRIVLETAEKLNGVPENKILDYINLLKIVRGIEAFEAFKKREELQQKYPQLLSVDFSLVTPDDITILKKVMKNAV